MIIAICGKSGTGKGTVCSFFKGITDDIVWVGIDKIGHMVNNKEEVKEKLVLNFGEDIANIFNKKGNVGRPDSAKLCVKYGYASNNQDAFDKYLIDAYQKTRINDSGLSYEECIKLIKDAGGISILAHPKQLLLEDQKLEELLKKLIAFGLDGIEVYHSSHTKEDEEKYLALAEKYNLLVSAGSDYHGESVKPNIELGSCKVKKLSILDKIT